MTTHRSLSLEPTQPRALISLPFSPGRPRGCVPPRGTPHLQASHVAAAPPQRRSPAFRVMSRRSDEVPEDVYEVLSSPGRALEPCVRRHFEQRLRHDFGQIRIHTDDSAANTASAIDALAYTLGAHLVFGPGAYAPSTHSGEALLTHELVHVVQQSHLGTPRELPYGSLYLDDSSSPLEQEALALQRQPLGSPHVSTHALVKHPSGRVLQRFRRALRVTEGDHSDMTVSLRYTVLDPTNGREVRSGPFHSASHRPEVELSEGNYLVKITGRVSVLRDVVGSTEEVNEWSVLLVWPVRVNRQGDLNIRRATVDQRTMRSEAPWPLAVDQVTESPTVGIQLALTSTETTATSDSVTLGLAESGQIGFEVSVEPAGVGVAASWGLGGETSQQVSEGREYGRGSPFGDQFGLLMDLHGVPTPASAGVSVGQPITMRPITVEFDSGSHVLSSGQQQRLVRWLWGFDPDPDPFQARGSGLQILVEAYASRRGEFDYNWALSSRRAMGVATLARFALPGAHVPAPGAPGETPWFESPEGSDPPEHRIATVRVIDLRPED